MERVEIFSNVIGISRAAALKTMKVSTISGKPAILQKRTKRTTAFTQNELLVLAPYLPNFLNDF